MRRRHNSRQQRHTTTIAALLLLLPPAAMMMMMRPSASSPSSSTIAILPLPCADAFQHPPAASHVGANNRIRQQRGGSPPPPFSSPSSASSASSSHLGANRFRTPRRFGSFLKSIDTPANGEEQEQDDGEEGGIEEKGDGASSSTAPAAAPARFGDVVRLGSAGGGGPSRGGEAAAAESLFFAPPVSVAPSSERPPADATAGGELATADAAAADRKKRNVLVAVAAVALAFANYFYQFTHPLSTLQLLSNMQRSHDPQVTLALLGNNGKPTVVDFWAPWCENCRQLAPTLYQVQEQYGRDVNFVMVNGDDPSAWPLIEAFGVDAIPHMALVEADGTVDTALIGPVPKGWLDADLRVLIENGRKMADAGNGDPTSAASAAAVPKEQLPYQMLDVFANRPEGARRLQITLKQ